MPAATDAVLCQEKDELLKRKNKRVTVKNWVCQKVGIPWAFGVWHVAPSQLSSSLLPTPSSTHPSIPADRCGSPRMCTLERSLEAAASSSSTASELLACLVAVGLAAAGQSTKGAGCAPHRSKHAAHQRHLLAPPGMCPWCATPLYSPSCLRR